MTRPLTRAARIRRFVGITAILAGIAYLIFAAAPVLHLIDNQAERVFAPSGKRRDVGAAFISGDMGLAYGMGARTAPALAARGVPVLGLSSVVEFAHYHTREQVDAVVARTIRETLAKTGARRVLLMGQSYGADIVATAAPDLPAELRDKVAAIVLVVPGSTAFFRADPSNLFYMGTPDAYPAANLRTLSYAPVICIYGTAERDSLCPQLAGSRAQIIGLPGGHFLRGDDKTLVARMVGAIDHADPTILDGR
jgi:type IV secretory pathway VirJ component